MLTALAAGQPAVLAVQSSALRPRAAYLVRDLRSGKPIVSARPDLIDTPALPGSIAKIATLIAALEGRVIEPDTRIACTRKTTVGTHDVTCVHPDLNRPMSPAEALAHSCNTFFATVARRLPRPALNRALIALKLPPSEDGDIAAAAIGLEGTRASPAALLEALVRVAANPSALSIRDETRQVVIEGLKAAATYGTASAFAARKIDALAKTGTAPASGGAVQGIVIALTPSVRPTMGIVVVAPSASGADAAEVAAELIQEQKPIVPAAPLPVPPDTLRVGKTAADGTVSIAPMAMEEYVASVVAGEQPGNSPPAALEALAITARTYALANRRRHAKEGFDLCDLTHCQVLKRSTGPAHAAATATQGRILLYQGRPAPVFYTASCGGRTERGDAVWPQARFAFLPSQLDAGCERLPGWASDVRKEDLERALVASGFTGHLENLRVQSRSGSGRAAVVQIAGFIPPQIDGDALRLAVGRTLGWQIVKSTLFDVTRTGTGFRFLGRGSGHGVGLCMVGSIRWAAAGLDADDILHRYFPGLTIGTSEGSGAPSATTLHLELPSVNEGERRHLTAFLGSEIGGLARRLGVTRPAELTMVFHPTVESYRRVTKQPWWIAGQVGQVGLRIDLLPIATLRAKGLLEQTIRHELVHVLTMETLAARPLWVKEGVAQYFAGEVAISPPRPPDPECPPRHAVTASSHRDVTRREYLDSGTCVARTLASGRKWTEIQ